MSGTLEIEHELLMNGAIKHNLDNFSIGDRVKLIEDSKNVVYTIYSITHYANHKGYTLWNGEDYTSVEEWQIKKFLPIPPIGYNQNLGTL